MGMGADDYRHASGPAPWITAQPLAQGEIIHPSRLPSVLGYLLKQGSLTLTLESAQIDGLDEYAVEQRLLEFGGVEFTGVRRLNNGNPQ